MYIWLHDIWAVFKHILKNGVYKFPWNCLQQYAIDRPINIG